MPKQIVKRVGLVLTILALVFIINKLVRMDINDSILFGRCWSVFAGCVLVYAVLVYYLGKPWKHFVTSLTGEKIDGAEAYYICTKSNLMKYIPGNVFQFIGRNEIAVIHDLRHRDVALATVLDTLCMIFAALLVAIIFHAKGLCDWLLQYISSEKLILLMVVLVLAGMICAYVGYKKIAYVRRILSGKNIVLLIFGSLFFCIFYLLSALMFITILYYTVGIELNVRNLLLLIGTWAIGYLMGYLMPGSPGGIGIRELVLGFLLQNLVATEGILLATILLRVTNIIGEVIAFLVALLRYKMYCKNRNGNKE